MNPDQQAIQPESHDPIIQELHAVREKLVEKYQGDMHAYLLAARARALALGFQFMAIKKPPSASTDT
jgi:hypothetical protein